MKHFAALDSKDSKDKTAGFVINQTVSGLPKAKTRALEALETRICELFAAGQNTMQIAEAVNAKEHQVYNILARLNA